MRAVGQSLPRLDGFSRVTGRLVYGSDIAVPGMLHGVVVRSVHPHARILQIDTRETAGMPGVVAVLTADDVSARRFGGMVKDETVFAVDRVRFAGQPVAAVAAISREIAEEAARRIEVRYDPLPAIEDPLVALRDDAPLVHEDWASLAAHPNVQRRGNVCGMATIVRGDPERAFREADEVYEDRFTTASVHQAYLEPRAALAQWDGGDRLTVHANTQLPFAIQEALAEILDIPAGRIRVVVTGIGGGFGGKLRLGVEHIAALLARRAGRPVRVVLDMAGEFWAGYPRHPAIITLRTAVRRDGTIVAKTADAVLDAGAFSGASPVLPSVATLVLAGPYRIPHLRIEVRAVYTHKQNFGSYRAPTGPQCAFASESQMDMIARRIGLDPFEFRLRNILRDGDEGPTGQPLRGVALETALRRAAAAIGWGARSAPGRGKGIACGWWTTTAGPSGVYVKMHPDGSVTLATGCAEIGTGALTGAAQVLADELALDPRDITITSADTLTTPYDYGAQGSRSTFNVGNACRRAGAELRRQLVIVAAEMLEANASDLELQDGYVAVRGVPARRVSYADVSQTALQRGGGLLASGTYVAPPTPYDAGCVSGHFYPAFHSPSFHAHAAEVEVDSETGHVRILRYVVAQDVGLAINPLLIRGQIEGGVVQGVGQALFEQLPYEGGQPQAHSFSDYPLPRIEDAPPVESILLESPSTAGPHGARGVGEPPVIEPPAAVANALEDAAGVRVTSLPITEEKIFRALGGRPAL